MFLEVVFERLNLNFCEHFVKRSVVISLVQTDWEKLTNRASRVAKVLPLRKKRSNVNLTGGATEDT